MTHWAIGFSELGLCAGQDIQITDIDADGVADLVVGSPNMHTHATFAGDLFIFPGPITPDAVPAAEDGIRIRGDRYRMGLADDVNARLDLTGDDLPDIAVDRPGRCEEDVYSGFAIVVGPRFESHTLDPTVDRIWELEEPCWGYRHELAVADFDGDGIGDVAMSAAGYGGGGMEPWSSGGYGSDGTGKGFVSIALGPFEESGSLEDAAGRIEGPEVKSWLGHGTEALPDLDGDGLPELALGAPSVGAEDEGRAYIVPGSRVGSWAMVEDLATIRVAGDRPWLYLGKGVYDGGDQDGDGHRELLVAGVWEDEDGVLSESGRVWVFRGPLAGTLTPADAILTVHGDLPGDRFGYNSFMAEGGAELLGGLDLNGDGFQDWLAGAELESDEWRGAVYAFFGGVWD